MAGPADLRLHLARLLPRSRHPGAPGAAAGEKNLVCVSVVANLGLLCYFKYTNFFLGSLYAVLHRCGATSSFQLLSILAPLGISFYTFEAINYIVDVYRGRDRAERKLANFMLFILFFPHLIAGPIVRARDFLPQIRRRKRWDWMRIELGVRFFLMGLFKKWFIADRMALFADPVFQYPGDYKGIAVWMAVIAYALQIYGDFSGYTDMAIGTAHMLGFHLAKNFDMPYLSANVSEFWRRWHISLSSWLRDYLFIPLGGSRGGKWQTCRNLLITMTLGGLWHGASWTFIAWGLLHGLLLVGHRQFHSFCERRPFLTRVFQSAAWNGFAHFDYVSGSLPLLDLLPRPILPGRHADARQLCSIPRAKAARCQPWVFISRLEWW